MELRELFWLYKKHVSKLILISGIFAVLAGLGYFVLPITYTATGSLFVYRTTEKNMNTYFTYEGYYGQQTAISYTNTVVAFLESLYTKNFALNELKLPVEEKNLRYIGRHVRIKKASPQLITLSVNLNSSEKAAKLWKSIADNTLKKSQELNSAGDTNLGIVLVNQTPVIQESFRSFPAFLSVGLGLGLILTIFYIGILSYIKGGEK